MRRIVLATAAVAAALIPTPPAVAGPGLETVVQDDRLLLHKPVEEVRASMRRLRELGVDRVRLTAGWSTLTRDAAAEVKPAFDASDPAAYEQERWRGLDTAVRLAREAGLAVVMDVGFWGPHWATNDPPGPRARTDVDPAAFTDFAVAVARRYSGSYAVPAAAAAQPPPPESEDEQLLDDIFGEEDEQAPPPPPPPNEPLPAVDRFILWNEPNHQGLWMPQLADGRPVSPHRYRALLRMAYPAVKAIRPDATFLIGNTSSIGGSGGVSPLRFIRELACVDAALRPLAVPECRDFAGEVPGDGWAHHPYARNESPRERIGVPDDAGIADVPRMAALLDALARSGRFAPGLRHLHLTEFGYETGFIEGRPTLSEGDQAHWLTWAEAIATRTPNVKSFAQFLLADQPPAAQRINDSPQRGFGQYFSGLLHVDGRPKLAATTFTAGLFAQREGRRGVRFFGRLRLGDGPRRVTIERSTGGTFREVAALEIGGRDAFEATGQWLPRSRFRLTWPGAGGERTVGPSFAAVAEAAPPADVAVARLARELSRRELARFTVAVPGRLEVRLVRGRRTLARVGRTVVETSPYRVRLKADRAARRALRSRRAVVTVTFRSVDGPVSATRSRATRRR